MFMVLFSFLYSTLHFLCYSIFRCPSIRLRKLLWQSRPSPRIKLYLKCTEKWSRVQRLHAYFSESVESRVSRIKFQNLPIFVDIHWPQISPLFFFPYKPDHTEQLEELFKINSFPWQACGNLTLIVMQIQNLFYFLHKVVSLFFLLFKVKIIDIDFLLCS